MLKTSEAGNEKPNVEISGKAVTEKETAIPITGNTTGTVKDPEPMVKLSEVDGIINEKFENLKKELLKTKSPEVSLQDMTTALTEALSKNSEIPGEHTMVMDQDIDHKDVLKEDATFWSYGHSFSIHSEKRNGHNVAPPKGVIRFLHSWTDIKGTGRNKTVTKVCVCTTSSKKVADWIRKSPLYKARIFENIKSVANIDMYFAQKLADAANSMAGLDPNQILQRAQNAGIEISSDLDDVKNQLVQMIAMEEYEKTKEISKHTAVPSNISKEEIRNRPRVFAPTY